jgi:hypothetical protein
MPSLGTIPTLRFLNPIYRDLLSPFNNHRQSSTTYGGSPAVLPADIFDPSSQTNLGNNAGFPLR